MRQTREGVCTTVEHRGEHKNEDTAGDTRDVVVHQKQRKVIRTKKMVGKKTSRLFYRK